jgi:hypothetical protein
VIHAAQSLNLHDIQPQSWHFQELSAEPFNRAAHGNPVA